MALGLIVWVFATSKRSHWIVHIALGLILAGALGNMYDRAVFHGVRDMLRFTVNWYPYIFNLADVMLCIGVPVLMLRWLFTGEPRKTGASFRSKDGDADDFHNSQVLLSTSVITNRWKTTGNPPKGYVI